MTFSHVLHVSNETPPPVIMAMGIVHMCSFLNTPELSPFLWDLGSTIESFHPLTATCYFFGTKLSRWKMEYKNWCPFIHLKVSLDHSIQKCRSVGLDPRTASLYFRTEDDSISYEELHSLSSVHIHLEEICIPRDS